MEGCSASRFHADRARALRPRRYSGFQIGVWPARDVSTLPGSAWGLHPALSRRERGNRLNLAQELITIPSFKTEETTVGHHLGDYLHRHGYEVLLQVTDVASANILLLSDGSHVGKLCLDP
jgi:hypothetical protein